MGKIKEDSVKEMILEKAQNLFKQYGLRKTTMDEIAMACGKAKSTLYHYFKSKDEVFDAVIQMELKSLRIIIKEKVEKRKSGKDKLVTYFINFHQEIVYKMNLYRIVKHEMKKESIAKEYFDQLLAFEKSYITRIIEDSSDVGEFPELNRKDIAFFSEVLVTAFFGIVRYSIETEDGFDQKKLEMITNMLVPRILM